MHSGDENGKTRYATAIVSVNGATASTTSFETSQPIKESSGTWFVTETKRVLVGRMHSGDENGETYYISAILETNSADMEPAPDGTIIIPFIRMESAPFKESDSFFMCPENNVITGRYHSGDENGTTIYQYATLRAIAPNGDVIDGHISIEFNGWINVTNESSGIGFDAPVNKVIIGRRHYGDENASTQYAIGTVKFNGHPAYISNYTVSEAQKETSGWFKSGDRQVITARHHYGDENGYTYYGLGTIVCDNKLAINSFPFDLTVALFANEDGSEYEENFPMIPSDYVILSRYRQHIKGGTDAGYNKLTGDFVTGDSHDSNYYNIPLSIINNCYSTVEHKRLYNERPNDDMALDSDKEGYFLQPFANLHGDSDPNGRVPAYTHILNYTREDGTKVTYIDFWLFFGYNAARKLMGFHYSHQGDWENVMVELIDDKITGAWLNAHGSATYRKASELDISIENGSQQLTIFCAIGSHALYHKAGKFETTTPFVKDETSNFGYKWKITDCTEPLSEQPWKLFAGAWGEVGEKSETTGPLGAWYKRYNFWYNQRITRNDLISAGIISLGSILIVPNKYFLSSEHKESDGFIFEAPENMALVGRKHSGDENGMTVCLYASLKGLAGEFDSTAEVQIVDSKWSDWIKESQGILYSAPTGYIITGRQHSGDENGLTRYKIGRITFLGHDTEVLDVSSVVEYQEYLEQYGVFFQTGSYFLYTGRFHNGDEEGLTYNLVGLVRVKH